MVVAGFEVRHFGHHLGELSLGDLQGLLLRVEELLGRFQRVALRLDLWGRGGNVSSCESES